MNIEKIENSIKGTAGILSERGWAPACSGNISVLTGLTEMRSNGVSRRLPFRLPSLSNRTIVITASGTRFRDLRRSVRDGLSFVTVGENGSDYTSKGPDPSSELLLHQVLYNKFLSEGRDISSVIHSHPAAPLIYLEITSETESGLNEKFMAVNSETGLTVPGGIGLVEEAEPGSVELAEKTVLRSEGRSLIILRKHGTVSWGKSIDEALDRTESSVNAFEMMLGVLKKAR